MKRLLPLLLLAQVASTQVFAQEVTQFQLWEVDASRSTVGFDATSTLHDFTGICKQVGGGAHANLNAIAQTTGGVIWCQAGSLDTDNEDRNENMFENLGVTQFPRISFSISSLQGDLMDGQGALVLSGNYTIRGISKARSFPIDVRLLTDGSLHVTGHSKFLLSEHEVFPKSVMGIIGVDDEVEAWLDIYLTPKTTDLIQVTHFPISITETISMPGVEAESKQLTSHLYRGQASSFFDFDGIRSLSTAEGIWKVHLKNLGVDKSWSSNDQAFESSRSRMLRLEAKLKKLPESKRAKAGAKIKQTVDRIKETLAYAPPEGLSAEVILDGNRTIVRLGQRDWVVFEDLAGDAKIPGLFSTFPDLPKEIQRKLQSLSGTPSRVFIHSATASGTRQITFDIGKPSVEEIPSWNIVPSTWPHDPNSVH